MESMPFWRPLSFKKAGSNIGQFYSTNSTVPDICSLTQNALNSIYRKPVRSFCMFILRGDSILAVRPLCFCSMRWTFYDERTMDIMQGNRLRTKMESVSFSIPLSFIDAASNDLAQLSLTKTGRGQSTSPFQKCKFRVPVFYHLDFQMGLL